MAGLLAAEAEAAAAAVTVVSGIIAGGDEIDAGTAGDDDSLSIMAPNGSLSDSTSIRPGDGEGQEIARNKTGNVIGGRHCLVKSKNLIVSCIYYYVDNGIIEYYSLVASATGYNYSLDPVGLHAA